MRWIGTIAREVFGLFVDDGSFAIAILVWLLLAGLCLPWLGVSAGMGRIDAGRRAGFHPGGKRHAPGAQESERLNRRVS